jgi:hypothetical protein
VEGLSSSARILEHVQSTENFDGLLTQHGESGLVRLTSDPWDTEWWLRSPGHDPKWAMKVYNDTGEIGRTSCDVDDSNVGVRPAMWVSMQPGERNT